MFKDYTREEFLEEVMASENCPNEFDLLERAMCHEGDDLKECEECWLNAIKDVEFKNPIDLFVEKNIELLDNMRIAEEQYKAIKEARDNTKEELLKAMEVFGVTKFENDQFSITYVKGSTGTKFNATKFKKDYPEIYKEYCDPAVRAASIRFKVK